MPRLLCSCLVMLTLAVAGLAGCQKSLGPAGLGQASAAYSAGEYQQAYDTGARVAKDSQVPAAQQYEAAYIAGLAAQQLNQPRVAQGYLLRATQSSDLRLKGDAFASLGLSYAGQERYVEAAQAMLRAAEFLHGPEKANAYYHAGLSQQKLGQFAQARTSLTLAKQYQPDPSFVAQVDQVLATTGYTLQVGAFRDVENATKAAQDIAELAISLQLGAPRVVAARDPKGGQLQLVQLGQFSTFASARAAKDKLAARDALIVPLP